MKKTNFKFEDISFYVDNSLPYLSNILNVEINRLHNLNRKRFAIIFFNALLILPLSQVIILLSSNKSNGFYYFLLFFVSMIGVYINSKTVYVHNNILNNRKVNSNEELSVIENYGNYINIDNKAKLEILSIYKMFFIEDKFDFFLKSSIDNGIFDKDFNWLISDLHKYPVIFFHILNSKGILKQVGNGKNTIKKNDFVEISNKLFDIKVDPSMYSKEQYKIIEQSIIEREYKEFNYLFK